jgi:hypothetical protein
MHNGKYHTEQFKALQSEKHERLWGPVQDHTKVCECCGTEFNWNGRIRTKGYKRAKFCSRSCANNRQLWWNENSIFYKTIALRYWDHCCVICGFDKIVAIHHIDMNHSNNDPKNLIPLCPNHHEMLHCNKYQDEMQALVNIAVEQKWGLSANGNTSDLHSEIKGSIPLVSTIKDR